MMVVNLDDAGYWNSPEHAKVEKERKARVVAHFKASFGKGRAIR